MIISFFGKKTIKDRNIDIKFQFICDEINKGSTLLGNIETEKCNQHVYEANDRNKMKHFQKGYSRELSLNLVN